MDDAISKTSKMDSTKLNNFLSNSATYCVYFNTTLKRGKSQICF